jgi:SAM-dependent methyltransferase|tara:strand:- start:533 stop:1720 length:1188 start_codon:yes stop_codon:yes gene_type:complete
MSSGLKKEFLDLGRHPIANAFLQKEDFDNEFIFDLKVCWNEDTKLVSIKEFVEPERIFNQNYPYNTSNSFPMIKHFKETAEMLRIKFQPKKVLEIGSNSGPFIENFNKQNSICVEPCGNFSKVTEDMGYKTYTEFWTTELSEQIKKEDGNMDLIFAANCICHIHDLNDTFKAIKNLLSKKGIFVFEDPSLVKILERGSYDQIYDEHPHIFSVIALDNLLRANGLKVFDVDNLSVHGGSNRIYATHIENGDITDNVRRNIDDEIIFGLDDLKTYKLFADRVYNSKLQLKKLLEKIKNDGKKIVSIGATAKSTTVFNYCGIGNDIIDVITDTTLNKQHTFSPGMHIPVLPPDEVNMLDYDYAYLGAWNFKDVIVNKQKSFIENGGKFITHVPQVMTF